MNKQLIPCLYLQAEKAVTGFGQRNLFGDGNVETLAKFYGDNGADELLVFDFSSADAEHDRAIGKIRDICQASEIPVIAAGNIKRMEDVKKLIYAGCAKVVLNFSKKSNIELLEEVSRRFGKERMMISISDLSEFTENQDLIETYADSVLALDTVENEIAELSQISIVLHTDESSQEKVLELLGEDAVSGLCGAYVSSLENDLHTLKETCEKAGIPVNTYKSNIAWSDFKLNSDGMVPVIVQDYRTDEVLMLAYMNELAFDTTLKLGKMTYWSRSRNELWTKGLTSGHVQYVKSLTIDCDNDTILAYVVQVGAACHTGNRSCFYRDLMKKEYDTVDPMNTLRNLYEKAEHKKAALIDHTSVKKQAADVLYHMTDLMAEYQVSWEDVTEEIDRREKKHKEG